MNHELDVPNKGFSDIFTVGFATTLAVWSVLYLAAMPAGILPVWLAATGVGCILLAGGFIGRKVTHRKGSVGLKIGLIVAGISVLILAGLMRGQEGEVYLEGLWWILGFVASSLILCGLGAILSGSQKSLATQEPNWPARFVIVTIIATLLMMISGGIVTGLEAGMAIEGWLTADGHVLVLFPLSLMTGTMEKFAEHAHRLWGLLVGLTTIVMTVIIWHNDQRRWVRGLALLAVAAVCVQGLMGGLRVTEDSTLLRIVHGMFAQMFFALLLVLICVISTTWRSDRAPTLQRSAGTDRFLAILLPMVILVQLALGAAYRHIQAIEDISTGALMGLRHGHSFIGSTMVAILVMFVGLRAWGIYADQPILQKCGKALMHTLGLQIALGIAAFIVVPETPRAVGESIPLLEIIITTAHQSIGAVLLAISAMYFAWTRRLLVKTD